MSAEIGAGSAKLGTIRAELAWNRPNWGRDRPNLPGIGQLLADFGRSRAIFGQVLADFGPSRAMRGGGTILALERALSNIAYRQLVGRSLGRVPVDIVLMLLEAGPIWARSCSGFARIRSIAWASSSQNGRFGPGLGQGWAYFGRVWTNSGQIWAELEQVQRMLAHDELQRPRLTRDRPKLTKSWPIFGPSLTRIDQGWVESDQVCGDLKSSNVLGHPGGGMALHPEL